MERWVPRGPPATRAGGHRRGRCRRWPAAAGSPRGGHRLAIADDTFRLGADVDKNLVLVDPDNRALDDVAVFEALDVRVLGEGTSSIVVGSGPRSRAGAGSGSSSSASGGRMAVSASLNASETSGVAAGALAVGGASARPVSGSVPVAIASGSLSGAFAGASAVAAWTGSDSAVSGSAFVGSVVAAGVVGGATATTSAASGGSDVASVAGVSSMGSIDSAAAWLGGDGLVCDGYRRADLFRRLVGVRGACLRVRRGPALLLFGQRLCRSCSVKVPGHDNGLGSAQAI